MWSIAASCCWPYPGAYGAALLLRDLFSPVVFSVDVQVCHVYRLHSSSARQIVLSRLCPISTTTVRPPGVIGQLWIWFLLFIYLFIFPVEVLLFSFFFLSPPCISICFPVFVVKFSVERIFVSYYELFCCLLYTFRVLRCCFNLFFSFFLLFCFLRGQIIIGTYIVSYHK